MAGAFPGMDPYLELQASWPDFHNGLINEIRNQLGARLPDSYVARVDERIELAFAVTARLTWVEIRALPELELVTAIEVLSPNNKSWQGGQAYLDKRAKLHSSRVNLVEIDLLLCGAPLPMKQRTEPGGYYAIVSRGARLPLAQVYRWTVRDPLPGLPIPLRDPDPDIMIDLARLVTRVYDLGRYARTLRRDLGLPGHRPVDARGPRLGGVAQHARRAPTPVKINFS